MANHDLSSIRKDYTKRDLNREDLQPDPKVQFEYWLQNAIQENPSEANAFVLSTVSSEAKPSSRVLLLKGIQDDGKLLFFTNYQSKKGLELAKNPNVSMLFWWPGLERQVRIEGIAEKASKQVSDDYFLSRPVDSQRGAICSRQSEVLSDRDELLSCVNGQGDELKRPDNWGGYLVSPLYFEFWQGRANRLHDRFRYSRENEGENWTIDRLYP